MVSGQKVIKVFNHEQANVAGFDARNQELRRTGGAAQAYANFRFIIDVYKRQSLLRVHHFNPLGRPPVPVVHIGRQDVEHVADAGRAGSVGELTCDRGPVSYTHLEQIARKECPQRLDKKMTSHWGRS